MPAVFESAVFPEGTKGSDSGRGEGKGENIMDMRKFTEKSANALQDAQRIAKEYGNQEIEEESEKVIDEAKKLLNPDEKEEKEVFLQEEKKEETKTYLVTIKFQLCRMKMI